MNIFLKLNIRNKKHDKIRSYFLYNKEKLLQKNINIEIQYIDVDNIDFSIYEQLENIPILYDQENNIKLHEYNDIIKYIHNLL